MKTIRYRIKLLEPTLVGTLGGEPNSARAFDYLPGSVLRGAIIGKYMQAQKAQNVGYVFDVNQNDERRLFFDGTTRYLNGYRLDLNDTRSLPTPLSWYGKKGEEDEIFDFAVEEQNPREQWKGVNSPFCVLRMDDEAEAGGATAWLVRPERNLTVHTQRTRRFGRAMPRERINDDDNEGAVYRYDALAAGQTFEAAILSDNSADTTTLISLLKGSVLLGGSRSGGYGKAELRCLTPNEDQNTEDETTWREIGAPHNLNALPGKVIVTLLSDALLRDGSGQFVVDADVAEATMGERLNGTQLRRCAGGANAFYRAQMIGGFNRKWGLPLPQAQALRMGSAFVFDAPACSLSDWQNLEWQGIGERRAEGFGRVAVNWHIEETWRKEDDRPRVPASVSIAAGTPSAKLAEQMVLRMLRARLEEKLTARANELGKKIKTPKPSQLSRLRLVIQDALREALALEQSATSSGINEHFAEGRARLSRYCQSLERRQFTRKQFTRDFVSGRTKTLLEWLRERIDDQSDIWNQLSVVPLPEVGGIKASLASPMLAYEYNLRLIDAVLARATKLIQRKEEE